MTPYVTLFPFAPYEHITKRSTTASTMTASAVLFILVQPTGISRKQIFILLSSSQHFPSSKQIEVL